MHFSGRTRIHREPRQMRSGGPRPPPAARIVRPNVYNLLSFDGRPRSCPRRTDVHEDATVKTGARRLRDFPEIHSASSAMAERQETSCGRSYSIPREWAKAVESIGQRDLVFKRPAIGTGTRPAGSFVQVPLRKRAPERLRAEKSAYYSHPQYNSRTMIQLSKHMSILVISISRCG